MTLLQILSTSIIRKNPDFSKLSEKEQGTIINQTYDKLITSALKEVKIPPKTSLIQQEIKKRQYQRRSETSQERHKILDYEFIEKLRNKRNRVIHNTSTSVPTSEKSIDAGSELSKERFSSSNKVEDIFTNFSDSADTSHLESKFFKSNITENIFKDETTLKNHIFRTKLKLEQSLKEIYFVKRENGSLVLEKPQQVKGIHVSKSLFQLYELFTLLDFVNMLEHKSSVEGKNYLYDQINNCYDVLFDYFKKWLEINGKNINSIADLENIVLTNDEFMDLDPTNPLFEGFSLLMEKNIDMKKVKDLLNDKELTQIFLKTFEKKN